MPLHQYAYFALSSETFSADEMAAHLGLAPDEVSVRGSRITGPKPIPVCHRWKIVCREPGLCVDEQIAVVLGRLKPFTGRIAELTGRPDGDGVAAVLQVVRYFNKTYEEHRAPAGDTSNLFGWHLDRDVLDFLAATGAELDVDEYDLSEDDADAS